jgi:glycine/serine hydroxymethyltransferase
MTRFGMRPADFRELADLMADVIVRDTDVREQVVGLRARFLELQFCFREADYQQVVGELRRCLL